MTDEGDVKSFLGVKIVHHPDGSMEFTQPSLIQNVLKLLHLDEESKMHDTPAEVKSPLDFIEDKIPREQTWNYRSAIGQLNYIAMNIQPDI